MTPAQSALSQRDLLVALAEDDSDQSVKWSRRNKGRSLRIDWSEVDLDRDQFGIFLETTSPFPDTRAGRLSAMEQQIAGGQINAAEFSLLVREPVSQQDMFRLGTGYLLVYRDGRTGWR